MLMREKGIRSPLFDGNIDLNEVRVSLSTGILSIQRGDRDSLRMYSSAKYFA